MKERNMQAYYASEQVYFAGIHEPPQVFYGFFVEDDGEQFSCTHIRSQEAILLFKAEVAKDLPDAKDAMLVAALIFFEIVDCWPLTLKSFFEVILPYTAADIDYDKYAKMLGIELDA